MITGAPMAAELVGYSVKAVCPKCVAVTMFEWRDGPSGSSEYGYVVQGGGFLHASNVYPHRLWRLLRCAGCGRAGLAAILHHGNPADDDAVLGTVRLTV